MKQTRLKGEVLITRSVARGFNNSSETRGEGGESPRLQSV